MSKPKKSIYDLELHESTDVGHCAYATRVPGGWIYYTYSYENEIITSSDFVPEPPDEAAHEGAAVWGSDND